MTAPNQRTDLPGAMGDLWRRVQILEASPSGSVWIQKSVVTWEDDVDAGVALFSVSAGDILLDWWIDVNTTFDFTGTVVLGLYHSDGDLWEGYPGQNPYGPEIYSLATPDPSSGGLILSPDDYRSLSNSMASEDVGGKWQATVEADGTMSIKTRTGTWAGGTEGRMTVFLMRGRAVTVGRP